MKSVYAEVQRRIKDRNEKAFHFFQSKSINLIMSNRKTEISIMFRDLEFMGDDVEYLKRYYMANQSLVRILKLINYYESNMAPPNPNLIPLDAYPITSNRHRKILKLQVQRQKSMARKRQEEERVEQHQTVAQDDENLLQHLNNSQVSQLQSNSSASQAQSFDSDVHDIFRLEKIQSQFRQAHSSQMDESKILDVKNIKQTGLIIDFKRDVSGRPTHSKIPNNTDSQYIASSNIKPTIINQYKNEIGEVPQFLRISSPVHQNEKKTSFMEYYNSLSTKSSSNILQKYIKSKKK